MRDGVDERGERLDEARDDLLEVGVRGAAEHEPRAELRPVGGVLLLLVDLEVRQQSLGELRHRFSPKKQSTFTVSTSCSSPRALGRNRQLPAGCAASSAAAPSWSTQR